MPQDRIVTVNVTGVGMRNQYGEFVPGVDTAHRPMGIQARRRRRTYPRVWRLTWGASTPLANTLDSGRVHVRFIPASSGGQRQDV